METQTDDIVIDTTDSIAVVRLNRPDRGNSVTPDVVTRMGEAITEACAVESVRAVVLTGTGSVFCAGADVQEMYAVYMADGADGLMDYLSDVWMPAVQNAVRAIWNAPKPMVAAFNGAATAGGLDFGLSCDVRVAASTARFAESYINLGMVPVAGGVFLLPAAVGMSAATELLASGAFVDAQRAHELGLVNHVCAPEDLEDRAREVAAAMAKGPTETFVQLKRIVRASAGADLERVLQESYDANVGLLARHEVRERVLAVMERYSRTNR